MTYHDRQKDAAGLDRRAAVWTGLLVLVLFGLQLAIVLWLIQFAFLVWAAGGFAIGFGVMFLLLMGVKWVLGRGL